MSWIGRDVRRQPVYLRVLRVRHLRLHPVLVFLLFEGSIGLGLVLALADIVSAYGIIAIPAAVAAMVKFNDVIAGAFVRPYALAQLRTPRPRDVPAVGRGHVRSRGVAAVPLPGEPESAPAEPMPAEPPAAEPPAAG